MLSCSWQTSNLKMAEKSLPIRLSLCCKKLHSRVKTHNLGNTLTNAFLRQKLRICYTVHEGTILRGFGKFCLLIKKREDIIFDVNQRLQKLAKIKVYLTLFLFDELILDNLQFMCNRLFLII